MLGPWQKGRRQRQQRPSTGPGCGNHQGVSSGLPHHQVENLTAMNLLCASQVLLLLNGQQLYLPQRMVLRTSGIHAHKTQNKDWHGKDNKWAVCLIKPIFLELKNGFLLKGKNNYSLLINLFKLRILKDDLILKSLVQFSIYIIYPLNLIRADINIRTVLKNNHVFSSGNACFPYACFPHCWFFKIS